MGALTRRCRQLLAAYVGNGVALTLNGVWILGYLMGACTVAIKGFPVAIVCFSSGVGIVWLATKLRWK